jgi:hypothetical protein
MNKKSLIVAFLSAVGMLAMVNYGKAASEPALADGNVTNSLIGTFHTSTGTSRQGETRRVSVSELGEILTLPGQREVVRSTGTGIAGIFVAGNSSNTFTVTTSSWSGAVGVRNIGDNGNVVRLASLSNPVYVDKVITGEVAGNATLYGPRVKVRLFDSWGSTAPAFERFSTTLSSGAYIPVELWFSSGVVLMKDGGNSDVQLHLGKQNR